MFFKILLNYVLGYVNISVEGYFIEKFLNICGNKKIALWNSNRKSSILLNTNIGIKDFKRIKETVKKTKCKVKINNKKGLPFILNKYRKRKIFVICLCMVMSIIFLMSRFIWNIEVVGSQEIDSNEIIKIAQKNNLKIGVLKNRIDVQNLAQMIRIEREDVSWVTVSIKGTNAIIEIVESTPKPNIINKDQPCNIIATKDAIITKVNAQNGVPVVGLNSIVKKGDILISGTIEGKYTGIRKVHATGTVYGKTWYSVKEKVYLKQQKNEYTGRFENKFSVIINNFKINFNKGVSKFKNYDTIESKKKLRIFSHFYLPIEIEKITNKEVNIFDISYTENEAEEIGIKQAKEKLDKLINNQEDISDVQTNIKKSTEYIEIELIYEVIESIGTEEKITN